MAFDVEGARKAGYSEAEIANYLASQKTFDVAGARKAGYGDQEIISHLLGAQTPKERSFLKDVGAGVVSGAGALAQLPGQLYGLATGDFSDTGLTKVGRQVREFGEEMKSPGLKQAEAERAAKIKEAGKEGEFKAGVTAFMETIKDPSLLSNFIAEQAPNLLPGLAVARGLGIAGAGAKAAVSGAVGTGAVQQGADIGAGTYEQLYKEMVAKGVPETEAAGRALGYARATGAGAAVISLVAQRLPGGRAIEEAMAKVPVKGGRLGAGFKSGLGETGTEMLEEGGGKVAQNFAAQQIDPTRSLTEGLGETMGMAAVGGLGLGTAAGLTRGREAPPPEVPPEPEAAAAEAPPEAPAAPPLMLEGKGAFVPVALPDGTVAMTREDLARYEEEEFRKKYEPQAVERPAEEPPAPPAMPTEAGLSYGTATQEIEILKREPKTPETTARIRELQLFKTEQIMDQMRRANEPVRPELVELREQIESGIMTDEVADLAMNKIMSDFARKTVSLTTPPKTEEEVELRALITDANKLSRDMATVRSSRGEKNNLRTYLRGKLTPEDVIDIGTDKTFKQYAAKKSDRALELSDMVADGFLDPWLPANMRSEAETFDEKDATEYIKEQVRQENFRPYDAQENERLLGEQLQGIEKRIAELRAPTKVQEAVAEIPIEEAQQEAAEIASRAGFEGAPIDVAAVPEEVIEDEYYPDQSEVTLPPAETEEEIKQDDQDKKQAESAGAPDALGELVALHLFGKAVGAEPKFKAVPGGVSADLDFNPNKALADAVANNDPAGVIAQLERSKNPFVQRIANLAKEARPFGVGLFPPEATRSAKKYSGIYVPSERNIYMRSKATAAVEHVVAHELVHHLTMDGLRNPTEAQKPAVKKINDLYKHVKSYLSSRGKGKLYGLTNVEEFVAEANSNVNFQYQLASIPYQRQSAWSAFTKFVADLLGFKNSNALTEIIALTDELVSKPGQQAQFSKEEVVGVEEAPKTPAQKARAAAQKALQKRTLKKSQFEGVSDDLYTALEPVFAPEKKTIVDKIDGMRDNFWKKLAQGVADQYRTIKDYSPEAYMKARMSKTIDGALEGLLFNGQVKLSDGALDIAPNTKGLMKVLEPVGNEVDRYQIWVALQRDAELVKKGKAPSVNKDIVARRNELSAGKIGDKSRLEVYKQVQKDMNDLNRSVLQIAYKQGIIDEEAFKVYSRDINYIPFYKVMEENGDAQVAATKSGLVNQYFSKELKGGEKPFGDLMENTLRNWSHILSASMKNEAANATVNAAMDVGGAFPNLKVGFEWRLDDDGRNGKVYSSRSGALVGDGSFKPQYTSSDGKGLVKTMIGGKPAYFKVEDPMLLESIMSIGYMGPKSKFIDVARDFKNMLQFGVTLSPAFKIRNLFRDSISAIAVTDLKRNPFANVIQGWTTSDRNNPAHISALAGGAIFNFGSAYEGDQSKLIRRLLDQGIKGNTILDNEKKIEAGLRTAWRAYQDLGNKSESANRMALYNQLKEQGYSHLEASFYARDMLDFSMQGAWPAFRLVTQVIPFLNARVQGLYKLGRDGLVPTSRVIYNTVTGKPIEATDKQRAEQFSIVMGAVVLASMMLYMAFKDDEEFKKREQWDRDNFWWIKLPGMDSALRVPKPFEIGAMGTLAERVLEQIIDQGAEGKVFGQSLSRMLTDTFAINPIPQVIKPLVDLYANKDSFTGAPIETAGMERLSKAERIADRTSPLAIALSKVSNVFLPEATEVSPVQVDYAIKGYLGWLGGTISSTSHYAVMPFSKSAYPDANWTETMSMGFIKTLPATQSKYVTAFYENNKDISQAYADMRHFAQLGQADKVQEILEEKGDKIAMAKFYDNASKDMAKMRQAIQAIRNDENMTGAQKKEEIDRMKVLIGELAQQMEEARLMVKKEYAASR